MAAFHQVDLAVGCTAPKRIEDGRKEERAEAAFDADANSGVPLLTHAGELQMSLVEPGKDASCLREENDSGSGWRNPMSAGLRSSQQPLADDSLEHGDLVTDRRLGVAELARRALERLFAGNGLECREMPDLDPVPARAGGNARAGCSATWECQLAPGPLDAPK